MSLIQKTLDYRARRIIVKIGGVDKSNLIDFSSLEVRDNLYSKANECYFTYEKYGDRTYVPTGGDEIGVYDRGTKIFGGKITNVKVKVNGKVLTYDVECKDWVDQLDGELVSETYENQTVNAIITDIQSKYATTFDITNVNCTTNIEAIYFAMKPVSKCLDELAKIAGYHWYVDADKKIYFFSEGSITSPFNITDTNGRCLSQSLDIVDDYEQIKNRVNITGGSISNVQVYDSTSITNYGEHEVIIKDDTLTSTAEATQKANAVLAAYKDPIKKGSFETYDAGLTSGQKINVNSVLRGVSQDFIISSVGFKARTPTDFIYDVEIMTQQDKGLMDFFEQEIMKPLPETEDSFGNRDFTCDIKFSVVNYQEISWEAGHIIMSSGETYNVAAGNHTFTNTEICYFNPSVSTTVLQFSTTLGDGVGDDRVALGYAIPNPNTALGAQFIPKGFMGGVRFWGGENIVARTIIADQIGLHALTSDLVTTGEFITLSAQIKNAIITNAHIGEVLTVGNTEAQCTDATANNTATIINGGLVTTGSLQLNDGTNTKAGITAEGSGDTNIRIWAGDTYANRATAPFRVNQAGALVATSATISGSVTITSGSGIANLTDAGALATKDSADYSSDVSGTKPPTDADKTSANAQPSTWLSTDIEKAKLGTTVMTGGYLKTGMLNTAVAYISQSAMIANAIIKDAHITGTITVGHTDATVGAAWNSNISNQPKIFRIVSVGDSSTTQPIGAGLYDENNNLISGGSRSYTVDVYNRSTGAWVSHTIYDVFGSANNATTMANDLNNLDNSKIVIVRTDDEPQSNRLTNGLPEAIYRCGGSRTIFTSANFKWRSAYILIGIPDIGEGNGIELYAGDVTDDPNAWVETTIIITASGNVQLGNIKARDAIDISYSDGTTIENLKPAQANADQTSANAQSYSWVTGTKPPTDADHTASNSQDYSWVTGTKPPTDADHTASNTAADSNKIQGYTAISGGKIVTGLLTADNIQAGTLTGRTIQTASSTADARVVIGGGTDWIKFYDTTAEQATLFANGGALLIAGSQSDSNVHITGGTTSGSVALWDSNTLRFATSSSGVNVTGNITVSGTVDGTDISSHVGNASAHHTKYTDSDARSAITESGIPGTIYPSSDRGANLGTSSYRWNELHNYLADVDFASITYLNQSLDANTYEITGLGSTKGAYLTVDHSSAQIDYQSTLILDFYSDKLSCKKPFGFEVRSGTPGAASDFKGYMYYDDSASGMDLVYSNGSNWLKVSSTSL